MKQYRQYPIFINYNIFTDEERAAAFKARTARFNASREAKEYAVEREGYRKLHGTEAFDYKAYIRESAVKTGEEKRLDEIAEETATPESLGYESDVTKTLDAIWATVPGKILLESLNKLEKVWIVYDQDGPGVASTTPAPLRERNGRRRSPLLQSRRF